MDFYWTQKFKMQCHNVLSFSNGECTKIVHKMQLLKNVWYFIYVTMKFGCSLQWTINILLNAWLLFFEDEKQVDLYYLLKVLFGIQLLGTPMFTHVLNLKCKPWFTKEKCFIYSQVATHSDLLEKFKIER